ncbi:unnamed protein product [Ostreobium quekettii]|uniref:SH2 domain-containing protein n=1 Tax=Ostreobium quekettii TaxID=121088 RepID=A0A8S1J5C5_9CHLO|nr:unnamed protein product [Ostreobium quekettii]
MGIVYMQAGVGHVVRAVPSADDRPLKENGSVREGLRTAEAEELVASPPGDLQRRSRMAVGTRIEGDNEIRAQCLRQGIVEALNQPAGDRLGTGSTLRHVHPSAVRQFIQDKYADSGLRRPLTDPDLKALEVKAGVREVGSGSVTDIFQWHEFQTWFNACLRSLKVVEHLWNASDVMRICPFAVDRDVSECLLRSHPNGTFLVRTCSLPGAFAISTKVEVSGLTPEVNHVLIDALDLKGQPLENWITQNEMAQNLLDIQSGEYAPKCLAFQAQAVAPVNSPSELSSPLCVAGPLLSPSPLSSITTIDPGTPTFSIDRAASEEAPPSLMVSMLSQRPLHSQIHLHGRQLHQQPPLAQRVRPFGQDDFRGLQRLVDAVGAGPHQLAAAAVRGQMLGKRSSSTSVGTTLLVGERPYKRQLLGLQDDEFFPMQHALGGVSHIEHCNG